ncbi:hypothetical protein MUCCIDRAFT_154931 [Mucor lusitanicus CBS 277.49]|uniref:sn-1-specific diacylglycerol lipase n=1 Tax=Mucor lusitanicus CBS 277.49 TaxID=747725 RepID=A0A168Q087_MUCCL|nr:hypothetical protein MUCCIDRAFT_154931 [Mucor lusitanicus CBS 277.49]
MAHGGMLEAAQILAVQKGKVFEAIKKGLESYPHYGLVLCGHSLGAGVASLLSVLWSEEKLHFLSRRMMSNQEHDAADGSKLPRKFLDSFAAASIKKVSCLFVTSELSGLPAGRPIHCYTYGSPCVMSLELSQYCTGLVTSVVHGNDIVSGLSLGLLKDFKNIAPCDWALSARSKENCQPAAADGGPPSTAQRGRPRSVVLGSDQDIQSRHAVTEAVSS